MRTGRHDSRNGQEIRHPKSRRRFLDTLSPRLRGCEWLGMTRDSGKRGSAPRAIPRPAGENAGLRDDAGPKKTVGKP
jgi:hypothetical protein